MTTIALASASPRRRELLTQLGVNYQLVKIDVDETQLPGEFAADYVLRLAKAKASAGLLAMQGAMPALGADTIVVVDGQVLGKPKDQADFVRMMKLLSGRSHQVMTAVAIAQPDVVDAITVSTDVWFGLLADTEIEQYWHSGEPQDKAGGYGIQGIAGRYIEKIQGSYTAVVGLPLFETAQLLGRLTKAGQGAL
jgi:septum formation protein